MSRDSNSHRVYHRRAVLKAIGGTTGAAALAGCSGGGDTGDGTSGDGGSGDGSSGGSGDGGDSDSGGSDSQATTSKSGSSLEGREVHMLLGEASPEIKEFWDGVTSDFKEETGAEVNLEFTGVGQDAKQRVIQLIQAGDPPELFNANIASAWNLAYQDAIAPINEVFENTTDRFDQPYEWTRLQDEDGNDLFLAWWLNNSTWFYRDDIADGLVPDSAEKALEYAKRADQSDKVKNGTLVVAGTDWATQGHTKSWAYNHGGTICTRDSNGEVQVAIHQAHRDNWIETMNFLKELHQYSPEAADASWGDLMHGIQSGVCATNWYGGARPKNRACSNNREFGENVHPIPGLPPTSHDIRGRQGLGHGDSDGMVALKDADVEAAKAFLSFFMKAEYIIPLAFNVSPVQNVPAYPSIIEMSEFQQGLETFQQNNQFGTCWTMEDLMTSYREVPKHALSLPGETEPANPFIGPLAHELQLATLTQDVLIKDMDPGQAVDKNGQELQSTLDRLKQGR